MRLILGDAIQSMSQLHRDGVRVDAVIVDPPYWTTRARWDTVIPLDEMWDSINKLRKGDAPVLIFCAEPFGSVLRMSNIRNYKYDWYWRKDRALNHLNAKRQPMRNIEQIAVFYAKGYYPIMERWGEPSHSVGKERGRVIKGSTTGDFRMLGGNTEDNIKYPRTLLEFKMPHLRVHPTQKPVALLEYLIKTYTQAGETVLDFTMGSGTAGVACKMTGRDFIGIESSSRFFNIAVERIAEARNGVQLQLI